MPPCSSIPAVGQGHADARDAGARSSRAARSRRCRAMTVSQSGLPAAPSRESPSTSSCVSASTPPCWRQIHERQCPGKAAPFAGHLQENHAGVGGTSMLSVRSEQARRACVAPGNARSVPFAFARASRGRVACVSCAHDLVPLTMFLLLFASAIGWRARLNGRLQRIPGFPSGGGGLLACRSSARPLRSASP